VHPNIAGERATGVSQRAEVGDRQEAGEKSLLDFVPATHRCCLEPQRSRTCDQRLVLGKTRSGAVFTAGINGGVTPEDAGFSFEIRGSEGWLSLTGDHPYGFQAGDLKLTSNIPFAAPEEPGVSGGFMGAAINVGEVYAHLVRDLHAGTHSTPGFEHAVHNARLIAAVRRAAEQGARQKIIEQIEDFDEARVTSV
jgi:predicted dehydrogenase